MKLHFGHLLGLSAIAIAGCAAFFSVYGISQLFAGAFLSVVIMASALEFGKLIAASYLQRYWKKIAVAMRIYVVTGVLVLVCVTSAGIYGFLSNAYQQTSNSLGINDAKVKNITLKKNRYNEELDAYTLEKSQLSTTVNELSKGLANNVIQYIDPDSGQLITTTSSSTRRALEGQLSDAKDQRDKISPKMDILRDSVTSLELQILDLNINNEAGAELGPLIYISQLLNISMDRVVNYFILLLIFVFDPLAIALVLATNKVFEDKRIEKENLNTTSKRDKSVETDAEYFRNNSFETLKSPSKLKHIPDSINISPPVTTLNEVNYDEDAEGLPPMYDKEIVIESKEEVDVIEPEIVTSVEKVLNSNEEATQIISPSVPISEPPLNTKIVSVRPPIPQNERVVAKNGIVKPPSTFGKTTITSDGPIKREDIKEIKQSEERGFIRNIPRRRGYQ